MSVCRRPHRRAEGNDCRWPWYPASDGAEGLRLLTCCRQWEQAPGVGQAARGSGGVPIPGGVQTPWGCGTWGHGLAGMVGLGWWLDLMILGAFSNLRFYDSIFFFSLSLDDWDDPYNQVPGVLRPAWFSSHTWAVSKGWLGAVVAIWARTGFSL